MALIMETEKYKFRDKESRNIVTKLSIQIIDTLGQSYCIYRSHHINSNPNEWFLMPECFFNQRFEKDSSPKAQSDTGMANCHTERCEVSKKQ